MTNFKFNFIRNMIIILKLFSKIFLIYHLHLIIFFINKYNDILIHFIIFFIFFIFIIKLNFNFLIILQIVY